MQLGAAYIRVSTEDQTEYSPEAQIHAIREYAKRNDIIITNEFIFKDEGISGRRAERRPAFQKMIAAAKSKPKPFDIILVHKFDRFARNREDSVVYKSLLRKECGIKVVSITEQIEDDKFSIILESMLEAMAEYYSLNLSEEVKKGMTEKAKRGEVQTVAPFGYGIESNKYIVNECESKIVKQIFNQFINGATYLQITRELNLLGVKTHRGNSIENRTIQYIIRNPVYIGKIRWNPSEKTRRNFNHPDLMVVDGTHEAIIDNETFGLAQKRADQLQAIYRPYYKPIEKGVSHWLFGVLRCSNCGGTLVKNGNFFQCGNYNKGRCKISHYVQIPKMEKIIINALNEDLRKKDKSKLNILESKRPSKDSSLLKEQLRRAKLKLERIRLAFENGIDTIDEYKESKNKIVAEISQMEKAIKAQNLTADRNKKLKEFDRNIHNVYDILNSSCPEIEEKNNALRKIVKEIIYNKSKKEISIIYFV